MLKTAFTIATALCTQTNAGFSDDLPLPNQIIQSLFEADDYSYDQMLMMKQTQLASLPCTYWFESSWYDLTNIDKKGEADYWTSAADNYGTMVSFNFCQKLS